MSGRDQLTPKYRGIWDKAKTGRSPMSAILGHCLECMSCVRKEITNCSDEGCLFHQYRPYQAKPYKLRTRKTGGISDRYVRGEKGRISKKKPSPITKDITIPKGHSGRLRVSIEIPQETAK